MIYVYIFNILGILENVRPHFTFSFSDLHFLRVFSSITPQQSSKVLRYTSLIHTRNPCISLQVRSLRLFLWRKNTLSRRTYSHPLPQLWGVKYSHPRRLGSHNILGAVVLPRLYLFHPPSLPTPTVS